MIRTNDEQRKAKVGKCDISAVHYDVLDDDGNVVSRLNETCLFWRNGDSRVVGSFDDFDIVVAALRAAAGWEGSEGV